MKITADFTIKNDDLSRTLCDLTGGNAGFTEFYYNGGPPKRWFIQKGPVQNIWKAMETRGPLHVICKRSIFIDFPWPMLVYWRVWDGAYEIYIQNLEVLVSWELCIPKEWFKPSQKDL